MTETVRHMSDRVDDDRSQARAISELLTRVGALEGRLASVLAEVESTRLLVSEYREVLDRSLHSVRAQTGRSVSAAERVRKAQAELSEQVLAVRKAILDSGYRP